MSSTIKLYEHNQKAYDALLDMLGERDRACVIKPTGTGKFVIIAKMVQDNPDKRFLLLGTNDYMFNDQMANLAEIAPGFTPDKRRKNAEGKWEVTAQGTMSRLQEDFWEQVARPYGYERPMRHELRAKGYRSLEAYKVQVGTTRALKSEIETLEGARDKAKHGAMTAKRELDGLEQLRVESHVKLGAVNAKVDEKRAQAAEIDRRIAEKMAELDRLDGEIGEKIELRDEVGENLKREQRRLESVRRTAGRFEEDVEELEAIASLAERFDHAGRFEKRGMLDEIAARCDGLRGRVSQFVEEVRGAVGRLEVAITDLARRLGPRSARMTTKALKRDLAALERDYGEDDDRSPKARAAEAQRAARARDANRDDRPPQRSWSQSR